MTAAALQPETAPRWIPGTPLKSRVTTLLARSDQPLTNQQIATMTGARWNETITALNELIKAGLAHRQRKGPRQPDLYGWGKGRSMHTSRATLLGRYWSVCNRRCQVESRGPVAYGTENDRPRLKRCPDCGGRLAHRHPSEIDTHIMRLEVCRT